MWSKGFPVRYGLGHTPDVFPLYAEGEAQFLRWLSPDELRASHRPYRPPSVGRVPLPPWITRAQHNDFIYDQYFWCSVSGARGNLVALVGLDPTDQGFLDYGTTRYTLRFIESKDVTRMLAPKFRSKQSAWDKLGTTIDDALV
jgi:hypothetical protein